MGRITRAFYTYLHMTYILVCSTVIEIMCTMCVFCMYTAHLEMNLLQLFKVILLSYIGLTLI